jgi:CMP-N-acetylneuraminic acid synthetase
MYKGKSILAIIPARGGSKGIPRKNLKELAGKPLIVWTIEEAGKSKYIDRIILTSEDDEIIKAAQKWGCEVPFVRPAELAGDDTPGIKPVIHAINAIGEKYDYIVLLQPTSPLRTANDIDACIQTCIQKNAPVCVSVCASPKSPFWMYTLNDETKLCPLLQTEPSFTCRQSLPPVYVLNGALYVAQADYLLQKKCFISEETLAYIMPADRSWDIDDEIDFRICDLLKRELLPSSS